MPDNNVLPPDMLASLPPSSQVQLDGTIAIQRINRAAKRNALDHATVLGLERFFSAPPAGVRALVLDGEGDHFSAGLDLSEMIDRDPNSSVEYSMVWSRAFERIERGSLPVISVLKDGVIGGGLELASATRIQPDPQRPAHTPLVGRRGGQVIARATAGQKVHGLPR
jgi:(methylthio)acryloyl-CoA hydratase